VACVHPPSQPSWHLSGMDTVSLPHVCIHYTFWPSLVINK
jgi:hypothetical protein